MDKCNADESKSMKLEHETYWQTEIEVPLNPAR
jgi:hypothetical protein